MSGVTKDYSMKIETQRLVMRQWQQSDYPAYAEYYGKEETAKFVGGVVNARKAWYQIAALAGHWELKGFGVWAVEDKDTKTFVGAVGLWKPEGWPELELTYWLTKQAQGQGFATEAAARAREFAYQNLDAVTLVSYIDPSNEPSKRVAERLGAVYEQMIDLVDNGPHCVYRHLGSTQ